MSKNGVITFNILHTETTMNDPKYEHTFLEKLEVS